ncbi:MAG TPA: hypothetical protein VLS48_03325 [Anaerolineales bacterium]|nr:hypothetical protein [Anaerolineales bacterium]
MRKLLMILLVEQVVSRVFGSKEEEKKEEKGPWVWLAGVLGVASAAAFWWWRSQQSGEGDRPYLDMHPRPEPNIRRTQPEMA